MNDTGIAAIGYTNPAVLPLIVLMVAGLIVLVSSVLLGVGSRRPMFAFTVGIIGFVSLMGGMISMSIVPNNALVDALEGHYDVRLVDIPDPFGPAGQEVSVIDNETGDLHKVTLVRVDGRISLLTPVNDAGWAVPLR